MSKKIIRLYANKASVKAEFVPTLAEKTKQIIRDLLFSHYKEANLKLAQNPELLKLHCSRIPELSEWVMPTDSEILELAQAPEAVFESESGLAKGGHKYHISDEATCVTATLEIYSVGHIAKSIGSSWQAVGHDYGFKFSEEVFND